MPARRPRTRGRSKTPCTSRSDAKSRLKHELPSDARLVGHKRKHACEQFLYRSAAAKRAVGNASVGVELASQASGGSYDGKVKKVTIGSLVTPREPRGIG
jgi:hypothetical protein